MPLIGAVLRKYNYKIDRSSLSILSERTQDKLRYEKHYLEPYFQFDNGKEIFLNVLETVFSDINSDFTILIAKPGQFKTSKQMEDNGNDFNDFSLKSFSVADFRSNTTNFDFFFDCLREAFYNEKHYHVLLSFYDANYDKLKFNYTK